MARQQRETNPFMVPPHHRGQPHSSGDRPFADGFLMGVVFTIVFTLVIAFGVLLLWGL